MAWLLLPLPRAGGSCCFPVNPEQWFIEMTHPVHAADQWYIHFFQPTHTAQRSGLCLALGHRCGLRNLPRIFPFCDCGATGKDSLLDLGEHVGNNASTPFISKGFRPSKGHVLFPSATVAPRQGETHCEDCRLHCRLHLLFPGLLPECTVWSKEQEQF